MAQLELFESQNGMIWWKKCDCAARYFIHLYVREVTNWETAKYGAVKAEFAYYEIARIEKDRHTAYHTFTDLQPFLGNGYYYSFNKLQYCVEVIAEAYGGEIKASSGKVALREVKA